MFQHQQVLMNCYCLLAQYSTTVSYDDDCSFFASSQEYIFCFPAYAKEKYIARFLSSLSVDIKVHKKQNKSKIKTRCEQWQKQQQHRQECSLALLCFASKRTASEKDNKT